MTPSRLAVVRMGISVASPLAALLGVYLLFAGHNRPGGGFAAGLVLGSVVTLRALAGMPRPANAIALITAGMLTVCAVAATPMLWGDAFLDMFVVSFDVPLLDKVKSGAALPFDIGVTAIVVGLIIAVLDGLGGDWLPSTDDSESAGQQ